ncbi:MAG: hypothetical protein ACOYLO_15500 [Ferruginibacter sp.]
MGKTEFKYFTFPVSVLQSGSIHIKNTCFMMVHYSVYHHANTLKLGDLKQKEQSAANFLNVSLNNAPLITYRQGERVANLTPPQTPKVSLKTDLVWDFPKNDKTEFEIAVFLAFAAFKSILGGKAYSKTNNAMLLARMAGQTKPGEPLPPEVEKYNNRYQLEKIKNELRLNWNLQIYGRHTQGFYFSFKMDIKQLVMAAEEKRYRYKLKQISEAQNEAYNHAIKQLYGKNDNNTTTTP